MLTIKQEILKVIRNQKLGDKFRISNDYSWSGKRKLMNILRKLEYVDFKIDHINKYNQAIHIYVKIKEIPDDFDWNKAEKESKNKPRLIPKGRILGSNWDKIINKINNHNEDTITFTHDNIDDVLGFYVAPYKMNYVYSNLLNKLGLLHRLGYITRDNTEKTKGVRIFKINKKIPDYLTMSLANKYLYDKFYKRARKLKRLSKNINT